MLRGDGVSTLLMCSCDVNVDDAGSWAAAYRDVVDASMSEVSGPGTARFVRRDSARNAVSLVPCLSSGALAEYVTVDDVMVNVVGGSAAVSIGESGSVNCVYTVDDGVREVWHTHHNSVCGRLMWSGVVRASEITGRLLQSYVIADGFQRGLVVSPNGRYMAVSYILENKLHVYLLEARRRHHHTAAYSRFGSWRWP
jgi:hypothetical protein